jgi:D-glycerate 3-kinase
LWQREFLQRHQLGTSFLQTAQEWFTPLAHALAAQQQQARRPMLVALNGCQGCGKTTVADFLCASLAAEHGLRTVCLSLDDFYLTLAERETLAQTVHPLLKTRGVPGTHDMALLRQTLAHLLDAQHCAEVAIPRFDKAADDRRAKCDRDSITTPVELVLLEGWCLGALPQSPEALSRPVNALERNEDTDGRWRSYSNDIVRREFQPLYRLVDEWIMLRAPSFDCVFAWRREQERKLAATLSPERAAMLMDDTALHRFIQHYERVTRQCLEVLPDKVHHLFQLTDARRVSAYTQRLDALAPTGYCAPQHG